MIFNKEQKKIINSIFGAYLISAPVGTGKTTVLTERIIKALEQGIKPNEILALTFTNRAGEEMLNKIKLRIKDRKILNNLTIKTFHSFCAYFIKEEAKLLGIKNNFIVIDEEEQFEIMQNILQDYSYLLPEEKNCKRKIFSFIDDVYHYKLNLLQREIGLKIPKKNISSDIKEISKKYYNILIEQNILDFNFLVLLSLEALYKNKKIQKKWSEIYKFIQLDEFQDTHLSEYLVIKELAKKHKNIAFIGDLDQTIYSWRGSKPIFISKLFKTHFNPAQELSLKINYRCEECILKLIKSFLDSFKNAKTKELRSNKSNKKDRKCVKVFSAYNFEEEVFWVLDIIKKLQKQDKNKKIAVLARNNFLISKIANIFSKQKVDYITVDKYDFFKRQEIKNILAYLKIIFNKFDLESAYRILSCPGKNIGSKTLKKIKEKENLTGLKVSDFLNFKNYNFKEPFENLINQWENGRIIVLDTETTGTNTLKDEIVQIFAIEIINGKTGKEFHYFLKNSIPVGFSENIHGISDEYLQKNGRNPKEILLKLKNFINNSLVVGHNVNFDLAMIFENGKRKDINFNFNEYYDTLDISRRILNFSNYKLENLANKLNLIQATHDARDDVLATVGLLEVLVKKLKKYKKDRQEIFSKFSTKFIQLAININKWEKMVKIKRPNEIISKLWVESGLKDFYAKDKDKEKRFKSIKKLEKIFQKKDDLNKRADLSLQELLNFVSLNKNIDFLGLEKGKIPIITIHQVKGLEFDYIFLLGLNQFKFPIYKGDIEEEKRLFYVALTRAKKKIYLSYSRFDDYNRPIAKSNFIDYLDSKYIDFL